VVVVVSSGAAVVVVTSLGAVVVVVVSSGAAVVVVTSLRVVVVVVSSSGGAVVVVVSRVQSGSVMRLESRVTAPVRARSRPTTVAPVVAVTDACAITVPTKWVFVPRVAELPICQKTLQGLAPFCSTTLLADAVVSVLAAWKIQTVSGTPPASSVRVPVRPSSPPV
jgi:hypothetical protein